MGALQRDRGPRRPPLPRRAGVLSNPTEIGALIRQLRLKLGLTQAAFAVRAGVSERTVKRWEAGDVTPPPIAELERTVTLRSLEHHEALALCDVLNGTRPSQHAAWELPDDFQDALCGDRYDWFLAHGGYELLTLLQRWPATRRQAAITAVHAWWDQGDDPPAQDAAMLRILAV